MGVARRARSRRKSYTSADGRTGHRRASGRAAARPGSPASRSSCRSARFWPRRCLRRRWRRSALRCARAALALAPRRGRSRSSARRAARRLRRTGWQASLRLGDALAAALEGRDLVVTGVVASLPQRGAERPALPLRGRAGAARRGRCGAAAARARLVRRLPRGRGADASRSATLRAGQRWRFTVRLRRPHGNLNPHGFDYELQLFEQGVRATGYVRDAPAPQLLDASGAASRSSGCASACATRSTRSVADRRAAGVLAALAVGDQGAIERDDWDLFRNTGVAHLMSISGLHVTMFAWLAGVVVGRAVAAQRARDAARCRRRARRAGAGSPRRPRYAVFSGWGVPAQRTVWMLATVALLQALGLRWPWPLVAARAPRSSSPLLDPWALTAAGLLAVVRGGRPADGVVAGAARAPCRRRRRRGRGAPARRGWPRACRARAAAHAGRRDARPDAADAGVLPAGVAGRLARQPGRDSARSRSWSRRSRCSASSLAPLWALGAAVGAGCSVRCSARSPPCPAPSGRCRSRRAWAQLAGLLGGACCWSCRCRGGRACWRCRSRCRCCCRRATLPAEGSFECSPPTSARAPRCWCAPAATCCCLDAGPQYSRESDAGQRVLRAAAARARRAPARPAGAEPPRQRPRRRRARRCSRALPVGALLELARGRRIRCSALARARQRCEAGQRWHWDGVRLRGPAPAGRRLRARRSSRTRCRACCASRGGRAQRAAHRRHRARAGGARSSPRTAPRCAATCWSRRTTAARPRRPRPSSTRCGRAIAVVPGRLPQPLRPSGAPRCSTRYRERGIAVVASPPAAPGSWRADGAGATARCQRDVAPALLAPPAASRRGR